MDAQQFVTPEAAYAEQAAQASGARSSAGMAPYPLYGIGQTSPLVTTEVAAIPFYRQNWFWFSIGASGVGALWAYFGWWKPRKKLKANAKRGRRGSGGTEYRVYPSTTSQHHRTFYTREEAEKHLKQIEDEYPNAGISEMPMK